MRVCIISSRLYPQLVGSGLSAHLMARSLVARGHEVTVITDAALRSELYNTQLPYNILYVNELEAFSIAQSSFRQPIQELYAAILSVSPDVLHVCNFMPMLLVSIIRSLLPYPVVLTFYNTPLPNTRSMGFFNDPALDLSLASFVVKTDSYDRLITGSKHYYETALNLGAETKKTTMSYLGIDVDSFTQDSTKYNNINANEYLQGQLTEDDEYILLPSRIARQKGIIEAVQALAIINEKRPVKLLLTGMAKPFDEGYAQEVWKQAEQLGVKDKIMIPSKIIPRHHLPYFFKHARLVIIPSLYEGLGLAAIDALVLQTPVVASNTVGLNEIIKNAVNGLTVQPGDYHELASATLVLLNDTKLARRLGAKGKETVKKFNIENHVDAVEQTYMQLVSGKTS